MRERELPRVQRLARERPKRLSEICVRDSHPPRLTIGGIADERPSPRGQVRADLMRAAGDEAAANEREPGLSRGDFGEPLESRYADSPLRLRGDHPAAIVRIATETQIDCSAARAYA